MELERAVGLLQIDQRLLGILRDLRREFVVAEAGHAQNVEHQHAVIRGDGAPAFGNDGGMRHFGFVAHVLDVIDDVVGVFLQRVIDARFEIGLRAVVIDAQAAADVQIFQARAGALQLHVHARRFHHRGLDLADVGDLAAQVEMQQLEAILHAGGLQLLQRAQRFASPSGRTWSDTRPTISSVPTRGWPA